MPRLHFIFRDEIQPKIKKDGFLNKCILKKKKKMRINLKTYAL